jgi:arylsulfatase A-like enzyme
VLIVIDTLRADHLPFGGYERNTAPFLSELAAQGIVFESAHSPSAWTAPATASIITSLYPLQHGVLTGLLATDELKIDLNRIPSDVETMGEVFKSNGYATFAVADNLNICEGEGFHQGFDYFQTFRYAAADAVNRQVLAWKNQISDSGPSFLYLHYMDPHAPYHKRAPWYREPERPELTKIEAYDSEIGYLDAKIRELGDALGWDEHTVIVVTSDHGEELGDHGNTGHGHTLYGELIDVPLVFRAPALLPTGRVVSRRVSTMDILPTLVELLDLDARMKHEGRSLMTLLEGQTPGAEARTIYSHLLDRQRDDPPGPLVIKSLIHGDWKLIVRGPLSEPAALVYRLYDLKQDPAEHRDIASVHQDRIDSLRRAIEELEARAKPFAGETKPFEISPESRERLKTLGYVQ